MRKGLLILLSALLILSAGAFADVESQFWTCNEDLYYHFNCYCGGAGDLVPISEIAAQAFDKYICPVCFQTEEDVAEDVQAVVRGGTIVVRFSDAWLAQPDLEGVFGFSSNSEYVGEDADYLLSENLHGDAYNSFLADYMADGKAEGRARTPAILATDGELIMSYRHIGGYWYVIVRPEEKFNNSWEMYWRIDSIKLRWEDDSLVVNFDQQTLEEHKKLNLSACSSEGPAFKIENDELQMDVYREMDTNIAVIYEKNADADFLADAQLRIPGMQQGIGLNGYMDGGLGVYCCTLTDGELELLRRQAQPEIWHRPLLEDAQFMDSPYAEVQRGTGDSGIIDREGNFVVEAQYDSVFRPHPESYRVTTPRPFFCKETDGGLTVLHGETLEPIVRLEQTDKYLSGSYINPTVFATNTGKGKQIRLLEDGRILFELLYDATGNYSGEMTNVDGYYRVLADGYPTRMTAWCGDGPQAKAWIIDNAGKRISDDFQRITPLIWSGDSGVFLVERFDPEDYDDETFGGGKQSYFEYGRKYDGSAYGDNWRCGLIDQDGNILVEMKYTALEVLEDGDIWLTAEDGNSLIWQSSAAE